MYYNNQNRPKTAVYGCSPITLIFSLIMLVLLLSNGLVFILRNLPLILVLAIVIWFFRKFIMRDENDPKSSDRPKTNNWSRDYEKNQDTSYDNIEREFEEVDDDEE